MKQSCLFTAGSILSLALGLSSAANAQQAATTPPAPVAEQPAEDAGVQDIVVTAQRREESLQRAAVAISAVGGDALLNAGVSDSAGLTRLIPALVVQPSGVSTSFFIRGVGAASFNSFQENAVAFSVGGVFYARPTAPNGAFYDLERVEVVKGPQGTLYGRNATAGAINLVPVQPRLGEFSGSASAEYGNYDAKKGFAALNVPIGSIAALRVSGQVVDRDGYLSDGYDDDKGWSARAQLLIEPSDRFSILLSGDYFQQRGKGVSTVLLPSPQTPNAPDPSRRIGASDPAITDILARRTTALFGSIPPFSSLPPAVVRGLTSYTKTDGYIRSDFWGLSATANGDTGFADLTTILAYRKSKPDILTYAPGFPGILKEDDDQMSAEVRLSSKPGARLGYVIGAFVFDEHQTVLNSYDLGLIAATSYRPILHTGSQAVFGQLTYRATDALRLVGGARYTIESKSLAGDTQLTNLFNPNAPFVRIDGALSYKKATWKAGVEFDAGPRSLLYANAATGFKAGGFYPSAGQNTYRPETLTAYTVGSKNRFLNNKLQFNVEAFYWKYKDQQLSYTGPVESTPGVFGQAGVTVNAGSARMFGVDADLLFQPTHADTFGASVQYLDARYNSLVYTAITTGGVPPLTNCGVTNDPRVAAPPARLYTVDCSGKPGLNSPRWTANLSYEHVFALGSDYDLTVGARSRLETASWITFDYLDAQRRDAYTSSDAFLTLASTVGGWSLTGFVNNIENSTIIQGGLTRPVLDVSLFTLRPPRTYGVRASVNF